jgi:hypothetical protein
MLSSPLAAPRLVGRDDESAFLLCLLEDALGRGPAGVALVEGDAGIGKTRLLAELRRRAAGFGALSVVVQAFEQVRDPYAPLVIAVARAVDEASGRVAEYLGSVGAALDPQVKLPKAKRIATVASALRLILRERSIALFFEDLHWADRATIDLLVFLSTELAAERFFIAATLRPHNLLAELGGKLRRSRAASAARRESRANVVALFAPSKPRHPAIAPGDVASLVQRVAERDSAAFERLYDAYGLLVYGIARRMLGDDGTAEDVTQAAFLKLWTNPQAFRGGNFAGWLARVTRNCALDALRREAVRSAARALPMQRSTRGPTMSCWPNSTAIASAGRWRSCRVNIASSSRWDSSPTFRIARSRASPRSRSGQ